MAGRKNHIQNMGFMGKDLSSIQDPFERDFAFRSMQVAPYCRHCGEQIIPSSSGKTEGSTVDWQWETQNRAHYTCDLEWREKQRKEAEAERARLEAERAAAAANFDWEEYMKNMLNNKDE